MLPDRFSSARARAAAIAVAFSVVAGGVAIAAAPSFAAPATVDEGGASASTSATDVTTETEVIPIEASGFTPGNIVYLQIEDPTGDTNWSWKTASVTVGEDGAVAADLDVADTLVPGTYSITVFESEDLKATFDVEVADATPTETPTGTATTEPTTTETPTGTATTEPTTTETPTGTATTEPTTTETPTGTPTTEPTATGTATTEPEPSDTTAPSEPAPSVDIGPPTAWADSTNYSAAEAAANGVGYQLSGFTPGVEVELVLTLPDGTVAEFSSLEPIIPAADGTYAGVITYSGDWPTGDYTVSVRTKDGQTIPVDVVPPASEDPTPAPTETDGTGTEGTETDGTGPGTGSDEGTDETPAEDGATDGSNETREVAPSDPAPGDPAPVQEAQFGFTIDAAPGGSGTNGGASTGGGKSDKGSLAQTGAEDVFGVAGLGLLVALAGAGVVVGARFLGRRRDV